ncbi:MAG: translation initiation factor [Mariprofundaceae bacterium]|nr:translation initiation factor [Mariprofundaceae bacterium]
MNDDRRLVYSTEHGRMGKPATGKKRKTAALPAGSNIKHPARQGVRIRREVRGRGGKTVCVVDGLSLPEAEMKQLLKRLKARLGTGGVVKSGCLEIQGDHRDKLLQLLEKEGFRAKLAGG